LFSELKFFQPEIYFVLLGGILIAAILSDNFCSVLAICSRYLFGFFGSILAGLGFFSYCHSRKISSLTHQASQSVKYASYITAIAFIVYGILGGLVVPSAPWFPANWLNQDTFLAGVGLPVQLFRSVCAVLMAVSINHILKVLRKAA
jgi:energy-converting hydrogenase Eha subunit G